MRDFKDAAQLVRPRDQRRVGFKEIRNESKLINGIGFIYQAYQPQLWYDV